MLDYFKLFLFTFCLYSCAADQSANITPTSTAIGKTNEIIIVCDQSHWEGPLGDSIRYHFESPYLILPQPEPVFDLRHFTPTELRNQPLRKKLRTYLLVANLDDENSETTKLMRKDISDEKVRKARENSSFNTMIGKNKWANGQVLVYLFGIGEEDLYKNIKSKFPAISERVRNFDEKQIEAAVYVFGENRDLSLKAEEEMSLDIKIPNEYVLAVEDLSNVVNKDTTSFIWMRKESEDVSSNIMLYSYPYKSEKQFSDEGIKEVRDLIGKKYISTTVEGSYMKINDVDLPMYAGETDVNGVYAWEVRGIWEMENDFMGGSFISFLLHHKDKGRLIMVDGFVYAPGKKKRDYMMQLEHVFRGIKI